MARLLVIIPDHLSALVKKGEITDRYYNPGNLFDEVHILMTNADQVDKNAIQKTVGRAQIEVHNLAHNYRLVLHSLGYRPILLRKWAEEGVRLAKEIRPDLVRCHGNYLNGFIAAEIKRNLGVKYIMSLHGDHDRDLRYHARWCYNWKEKLFYILMRRVERVNLQNADCVICVYRFIEPYARKYGAQRIEIIYNAVNQDNLLPKENYDLSNPVKIIIPGRQLPQKDPAPLIRAVAEIPGATLTLIGHGPIHDSLEKLAADLGISDRCFFFQAMDNDELCRTLRNFDILVSINDFGGVSKVELEAAMVGMPMITNAHPMETEPEILGQNCLVVDGSPASYKQAILKFIGDMELRKNMGGKLRESVKAITPEKMESEVVKIYKEFLK